MSNKDRSTNVENLLQQKQNIEEKIFKLQITLKGIEKSLNRIERSPELLNKSNEESESSES